VKSGDLKVTTPPGKNAKKGALWVDDGGGVKT